MKVTVDLCLIPLGGEASLSIYIARCQRVLEDAGLHHELHAYGTNIEGDYDTVMAAIKRCHELVHEMGAPRIFSNIKLGSRTDREQSLRDKVLSVQQKMESPDA